MVCATLSAVTNPGRYPRRSTLSDDEGRGPRLSRFSIVMIVLTLTLVVIVLGVVFVLGGHLPSAADCRSNPNLLGC